jgi:hypothetical protein
MGGISLLAAAAIVVMGSSPCPTPAAVEEQLRPLLPPDATGGHRVLVQDVAGGMRVELRDEQGEVLAERTLATAASCAERARASAVVIAIWEAELRAGTKLRTRLISSEEPSSHPVMPPGPSRAVAPTISLRRPPRELVLDVGVGASLADAAVAPAGAVGASLWIERWPVGARVALQGAAPRDLNLGPGQIRWLRAALVLGPAYRFTRGRLHVELGADLHAALLSVRGTGYEKESAELDFDPGLGARVRVVWPRARWRLFGELAGCGWLRQQNVYVDGLGLREELPRFDVAARIGAGWSNGPDLRRPAR